MVYRTCKEDSMRIGVFGISRSGKDTTIEAFIKIAEDNGYDFVHMSPIGMIRARMNGKSLKTISCTEKEDLVREIREEIKKVAQNKNVIVDEHYCFPHDFGGKVLENGYYDEKLPHDIMKMPGDSTPYEVIFPRFGTDFYDMILVIRIDPDIILERMRTSEGCKKNDIATKDEILRWQKAESEGVSGDARNRGIIELTDPSLNGIEIWKAFETMISMKRAVKCNNVQMDAISEKERERWENMIIRNSKTLIGLMSGYIKNINSSIEMPLKRTMRS